MKALKSKKRDNLIEKATIFIDAPSQLDAFRMRISEKQLSMQILRQRYSDSFYNPITCIEIDGDKVLLFNRLF